MRRVIVATPPTLNENDFFRNPFSALSAHHRPIGTSAQYSSDDSAVTADWNQANFTTVNIGFPWGVHVAQNSPSNPYYTVTDNGNGKGQNLPVTLRLPPLDQTSPEPVDNVYILYDKAVSGNCYEFYQFYWPSGGQPTANYVMSYPITGKGHGTERTGVSAAGISCLVGLTRGFEINTSAGSINHIMQFAIGRQNGEAMGNAKVWPATSKDWNCNGVTLCTGHVPYGSLWALPQSIYTDSYINNSMGLSTLGKKLAFQMRNYGGRIFDGASGRPSRGDQYITAYAEHNSQMRIIYPHLRLVTNDAEDQVASGGGTPIAPNTGA